MSVPALDAVGGKAVEVALTIGLFAALQESPMNLSELADRCQVSVRGLRSLVFLLSSLHLVKQKGDIFRLAPGCQKFLDDSWPEVHLNLPQLEDWKNLETAVRLGKCVRPPIEGLGDAGNFFGGIVETLFKIHWPLALKLATDLPLGDSRALDLGAGSAVWSLAWALDRPGSFVVAVDHEHVLQAVTQKFVGERGLENRYDLRSGSYHTVALEERAYEVVFLGHIVHSEGWEASLSLLQRCFEALVPGGLLVVAEWVASDPRSLDYHANLFDLNMLMFTKHGMVFSADELESLVTSAGLEVDRWVRVPGPYPVLVARRPS